jgi:tetratricopeptide (TPR) repeat protein
MRKKLANKNPELYLPKVADTQNNLSILYMDMGKLEEAEKCIIEVLKINPNYRPAWYNRACIESLRNNQEKSIKFLKRAIDLDKKYRDMAKTDEDLDNVRGLREFKELINK